MTHPVNTRKICVLVVLIAIGAALSAQAVPADSGSGLSGGGSSIAMMMGGMPGMNSMPGMSSGTGMMMDMDMDMDMPMGSMQSMPMDSMDMDMMNMSGMSSMPAAGNSAQLTEQLNSISTLINQLLSTSTTQGAGLSDAQVKLLSQLLDNQSALLKHLSGSASMPGGSMSGGMGGMGMMGRMGKM